MSNARRFSRSSASGPRPLSVTSYPSWRSTVPQLSRRVYSSSTTRIRIRAFWSGPMGSSAASVFASSESRECPSLSAATGIAIVSIPIGSASPLRMLRATPSRPCSNVPRRRGAPTCIRQGLFLAPICDMGPHPPHYLAGYTDGNARASRLSARRGGRRGRRRRAGGLVEPPDPAGSGFAAAVAQSGRGPYQQVDRLDGCVADVGDGVVAAAYSDHGGRRRGRIRGGALQRAGEPLREAAGAPSVGSGGQQRELRGPEPADGVGAPGRRLQGPHGALHRSP